MVNVAKLENCIVNEFTYGGILDKNWKRDKSIYLQPYIENLIQNYAAAFVQLAYEKHRVGEYQEALKYMEISGQISPQLEPPRQLLGLYYLDAGDTTQAVEFYLASLRARPGDLQLMYRLAGVYEKLGAYQQALDMIDPILREDPDSQDLVMMGYTMGVRGGMYERARGYLTTWLTRHPDDTEVQETLQDFDRQLQSAPQP
jgi:tetratricopeptide (TPR) repeat protein